MKTAAASLVLAAGVSGQFYSPYQFGGARVASPYRFGGAMLSPYGMRAPRMMAAPPAADVKAQLIDQSLLMDAMSYYTTGNTQDMIEKLVTATDFELKNTQAQAAFDAFKANPSRTTSLKAEVQDNQAKALQFKMYYPNGPVGGIWPTGFNSEGRYKYQAASAKMELADDALKTAERRMSFDADGADAYYNALASYKGEESNLWEKTFKYEGNKAAENHIIRQSYINAKRSGDVDDETFLNSFLMTDGPSNIVNEGLAAILVYQQNRRDAMAGQNDGPAQVNTDF